MILRACIALALMRVALCYADAPPGYYDSAQGKTGAALRQALHARISAHTVIPYSSSSFDTSDALKVLDQDPADSNRVILLYPQRSEWATNFPAVWSREHCWPNSYGLDDRHPAYSDLHNLRAEDATVNNARGNKFYDVSDTNHTTYRFPAHAEAPQCSTDANSWEPPASVKGDLARAMFYMDVRYEGDVPDETDLVLTDVLSEITSTTNLMGRLTTLLRWHLADPVSEAERRRNDLVYGYQRNRNPFVDHPEWVEAVFLPAINIARAPGGIRVTWPRLYSVRLETSRGLHMPWFTTPSTGTNQPNGEWGEVLVSPGLPVFVRLLLQ